MTHSRPIPSKKITWAKTTDWSPPQAIQGHHCLPTFDCEKQNVEKEQKLKRVSFVILLVALFLQSASKAASNTLWPLYLKSYFNFNPTSFSYLLLSSTVFSTLGISALPILGSLYGEKKTLIVILIFLG